MFFAESFKGTRTDNMPRKSRKRGKEIKKRGISKEQICVATALDRQGNLIIEPLCKGRMTYKELENLYKGGRLTKMQAGFGNFAKLKPVISIPEGTLIVKGKFIGRKKAIAGLVSYIEGMDLDERFPIYGIYSDGTENLDNFVKKVEEKGIKFKECYQIGPTIGTHVGPETFGFIAVEKAKN